MTTVAEFVVAAVAAFGQEPTDGLAVLESSVTEVRLENGWTVLLVPRRGAPVVSVETYADAGGVHEPDGRRGISALLGRVAFQGSDRVGTADWSVEGPALDALDAAHRVLVEARMGGAAPEEVAAAEGAFVAARDEADRHGDARAFRRLLEDIGVSTSLGTGTTEDGTRTFATLPANELERWCWLEAERLSRPVLRGFYRERDRAVREGGAPAGSSATTALLGLALQAAFQDHPYGRPLVNGNPDLLSLGRPEAERYLRAHSGGRRLTTAIVGDFDADAAKTIVRRHFARVPAGPPPPLVEPPGPQDGERRVTLEHPSGPALAVAWRVPAPTHSDSAAIEVAARLLGATSSRLGRRIAELEPGASVDVVRGFPGNRFGHLIVAIVEGGSGADMDAIESALLEEVARLANDGPGPDELVGARRTARAALVRNLGDPAGLAAALAENRAETGEWREAFRRPRRVTAVTADDVKRVLGGWFGDSNRTVARLVPPTAAPDGGDR